MKSVRQAQLGDIVPRTGGAAWTLLYTVILGLGSMCITGDTGDGSETLILYDKAVGLVSAAMFETSNLTAVQASLPYFLCPLSSSTFFADLIASTGLHAPGELCAETQPRFSRDRLPRDRTADGH